VRDGARCVANLEQQLGIGAGCGRYRAEAKKILQESRAAQRREPARATA